MRKITNIIFAVLRNDSKFKMLTPKEHIDNYNNTLKVA